MVVTGVPLASSCHFRPTFFTEAVLGAEGVAVGEDAGGVGVVVVAGVAGAGVVDAFVEAILP
jgi:hypothetical protein